MAQDPNKSSSKRPAHRSPAPLSLLETGIIKLFVEVSRALGHPRSAAEMYGLLFVSDRPLAFYDLVARLGLSKGGVSMGLKYLRNGGAVKMVYVAGSGRMHYEPVVELPTLATRFPRVQVLPQLDSGFNRLDHLAALAKSLPPQKRAHIAARSETLRLWDKQRRKFLPAV